MGHDIDQSRDKPAIAYVGETPWHGLGQKLPEGQPIEVWLREAQLDWDLKRLPVQYLVDGKLRTMDDRFVLARSDTGTALSIVSGDYHIVQPKEVLEFYRDLVSDYGYALETAGALNGGRKVWALARTGKIGTADGNGGDKLAGYVLLATSCDKSLATTATFTSIRVVCQNTLFFAMEDIKTEKRRHIKIPHNYFFDPEKIKDKLGLIDKAWQAFMAQVRKMAAQHMKEAEASTFIGAVLGQKDDKPLSRRAQREHETIMALLSSAPGQDLSTTKETLWGAVNAVTYYTDHVRGKTAGERLDSAWFGAGSALKDRAWEEADLLLESHG
jgi:phage/plasmid-like protein (TIGR03299 family)